jgi:hypothetical protein
MERVPGERCSSRGGAPNSLVLGWSIAMQIEPRSSALPSLSQGMLQWADRIADAAFIARTLQVSMGATGYFACERVPEPQLKNLHLL